MMVERRSMVGVAACASTNAVVRGNDFPGAAEDFVAESICPNE